MTTPRFFPSNRNRLPAKSYFCCASPSVMTGAGTLLLHLTLALVAWSLLHKGCCGSIPDRNASIREHRVVFRRASPTSDGEGSSRRPGILSPVPSDDGIASSEILPDEPLTGIDASRFLPGLAHHPELSPEREAMRPLFMISNPALSKLRQIDWDSVQTGEQTPRDSPLWTERYGRVTFFNGIPIYRLDKTEPAELKQALLDHNDMYLINPGDRTSFRIARDGEAWNTLADPHDGKVLDYYSMGPVVHDLYDTMKGRKRVPTGWEAARVAELPHSGAFPIFFDAALGLRELYKSLRDSHGFYLLSNRPGQSRRMLYRFTLTDSEFGWQTVPLNSEEGEAVLTAFNGAVVATRKYGPKLASLLYGKQIEPSSTTLRADRASLTWAKIPRLTDLTASRAEMADVLESFGKLRFHDTVARKFWHVKLLPDGSFDIHQLSKLEKLRESIGDRLSWLRMS
ncbi:hypothetical protein BCV70DRAFT_112081 [Testicularia cyperi]|uniref:Uncharacterized protein n=1 Tax=Testicularia cyperi TaxID=1882483 RepID=A0A317XN44_9BASI|nr:hypothetical protein BCV70DRAFT_112081 [Testicularia cyperi]